MKKSIITIGAAAIFVLGGTSAWAGPLTIPNAFTAGQPAVAADVNANFTAAKTAVDDNDSRITTNSADISSNSGNITSNAIDVSNNQSAISANTSLIGANSTNIGANSTNIGANTGNITTNTTSIGANTGNITTNTTNIGTNTTDIATNVTDIGTNTTDIATNVTNVGTNTSAISALQDGTSACPSDMVKVGAICVDIFEASVWSAATAGTQYGDIDNDGVVDVAIPCGEDGNDCSASAAFPIYARSVVGVTPVSRITWFQAQQACANVNKRLLSNAEWQMAAAGTPDPGLAGSDIANECNTNTASTANTGASTGGTNQCVSNWGTFDMVGNVHEWVADWMHGAKGNNNIGGTAGAGYGDDLMVNTTPATNQGTGSTNMPAAIFRGGAFSAGTGAGVFSLVLSSAPSRADNPGIGFRCAR